jgi:hypothetical protein
MILNYAFEYSDRVEGLVLVDTPVIENAGHFPWLEQPDQFFGGMRTFLPKLGC